MVFSESSVNGKTGDVDGDICGEGMLVVFSESSVNGKTGGVDGDVRDGLCTM